MRNDRIALKNARAWSRVNSATLEPPVLTCVNCGREECVCLSFCAGCGQMWDAHMRDDMGTCGAFRA